MCTYEHTSTQTLIDTCTVNTHTHIKSQETFILRLEDDSSAGTVGHSDRFTYSVAKIDILAHTHSISTFSLQI